MFRIATVADVPAIERIMTASARALSAGFYAPHQIESVVRYIATLDHQLVEDETYFITVDGERACGGWSARDKLFTGTDTSGTTRMLDPAIESARVRAMFVHPDHARRGLGRALLERCERAAYDHGFTSVELMATLPGEPLYAACGYAVVERTELVLPDTMRVGAARMRKAI